jgi:catechol 2,3-dioxygenase-like lactoylglutathione lyase family enzyme
MSPGQATIHGMTHIGLGVADIDASLRFYRDALGLEVYIDRVADHDYLRDVTQVNNTNARIAYCRVPDSLVAIELVEHRGVDRQPVRSRLSDPGNVHLGVNVDDIDAVHARLLAAGYMSVSPGPVDITAGPFTGLRTCFVRDPDGFLVELAQQPRPQP